MVDDRALGDGEIRAYAKMTLQYTGCIFSRMCNRKKRIDAVCALHAEIDLALEIWILALIYLRRAASNWTSSRRLREKLVAALVLASKYHDDFYFFPDNKWGAEYLGYSSAAFNELEAHLCNSLNFNLHVTADEYGATLEQVHHLRSNEARAPTADASGFFKKN